MKRARESELGLFAAALERRTRPLWRSLERAIAWQIDIGRLPAGARLPSTRAAARALKLSRNTVAQAFDSLIADGYLAGRVGDGTYVTGPASRSRDPLWARRQRWIVDPEGLRMWIVGER